MNRDRAWEVYKELYLKGQPVDLDVLAAYAIQAVKEFDNAFALSDENRQEKIALFGEKLKLAQDQRVKQPQFSDVPPTTIGDPPEEQLTGPAE
jgi:hypothetical protein